MTVGVSISPFEWQRYQALRASVLERRHDATVRLLAAGAAWRDPDAPRQLQRLQSLPELRPWWLPHVALAADPPGFAEEAARCIAAIESPYLDPPLVRASATAAPVELLSLEEILELSRDGGVAAALSAALGGFRRGVHVYPPADVQRAAERLEPIDLDAIATEELRMIVGDVAGVFIEAAGRGWGILVVN
jgi:hypothetical protein